MSLASVRPYFRARLNALDYTEWTDGFNFQNIPQTILDKSYHIEVGTVAGTKVGQLVTEIEFPVVVRVFFQGYRDPASTIDAALLAGDDILAEVLIESNAFGETIKGVFLDTINVNEYDGSDDNDVILELNFTAVLDCSFS